MPQKALRRHHHERPLRPEMGLPPEQVVVLRRCARGYDPHVVFGAELEKPL